VAISLSLSSATFAVCVVSPVETVASSKLISTESNNREVDLSPHLDGLSPRNCLLEIGSEGNLTILRYRQLRKLLGCRKPAHNMKNARQENTLHFDELTPTL
jgi:hypothetical protein